MYVTTSVLEGNSLRLDSRLSLLPLRLVWVGGLSSAAPVLIVLRGIVTWQLVPAEYLSGLGVHWLHGQFCFGEGRTLAA